MAIDVDRHFAAVRLPSAPNAEMKPVGVDPTLVLSSDVPVAVGGDGALFYPELVGDRLQILRHRPSGERRLLVALSPASAGGPRWLNGIAAGADGSIYYTEDRAVRRVTPEGLVSTLIADVAVGDCVRPPPYDERLGPHLRGLDVGADGTLLVAATGCAALLEIDAAWTPAVASVVLRAAPPWSPTAVVVVADGAYVLEYLHTETDDWRDWLPRVTKLARDRSATVVAAVSRR